MAMMVSNDEKDVGDLSDEAHSAKDGDVRNFARTALPALEQDLKIATADRAGLEAEAPSALIAKSSAANAGEHASTPQSAREDGKR
jgi:hypothetical protein